MSRPLGPEVVRLRRYDGTGYKLNCMKIAVAVSIFLTLVASGRAQQPSNEQSTTIARSGTVCVLPNSPEPPTRISPGGDYNPNTLTISIDTRPQIPWPHKHSIKIDDLDLNERHLIVLRSDGKRIQSFRFRFSEYKDTKVCVAFDGYQGVQFGDKYNTYWCKCK
jgi:hypothetical protein